MRHCWGHRVGCCGRVASGPRNPVRWYQEDVVEMYEAAESPGRPVPACEGGRAMGRGRAKAKQTKVARELKYSSPTTDLEALQRELSGGNGTTNGAVSHGTDDLGADDRTEDSYDDEYDQHRR